MLTYKAVSEKGDRPVNEDAIGVCQKKNAICFVLCDGLGGHGCGDVASEAAMTTFTDVFEHCNKIPPAFFKEAFNAANEKIVELQKTDIRHSNMRTTLVSLVIQNKLCTWSHIGDSRLYLFKNNSVVCRTLDHSVPQMLALAHSIKEKKIRFHPDRNKLLRALGSDDEQPRYEVSQSVSVKNCQAFLLCSDGFWEYIDEKTMCKLLKKSSNADEWLNVMTDVVLKNGQGKNMDNYSAIAVMNS